MVPLKTTMRQKLDLEPMTGTTVGEAEGRKTKRERRRVKTQAGNLDPGMMRLDYAIAGPIHRNSLQENANSGKNAIFAMISENT